MRHGLLLAAVLATLVVGTTSSLAFAAEPSPQDMAQARDLGGQAQAAFEAGNYAESEKLWVGASNLYPGALTLTLGLARTQAKLGKLVLSQESYKKIIRDAGENPNLPAAFKDAAETAKVEVVAVSAKIANVVILVEGAPNPQVTIDGQPVSSAGLGLRRPVDPGSHVVKAEAPGYKTAEATFQVAESGLAQATLKMEKAKAADVAVAAPTPNGASNAGGSGKGSNKTLAFAALGVGGAGLVFGTITGLVAIGKHGDLADKCADGKCPTTLTDDVDGYKTTGLLSTIGFIVGGVGLTAGAVLWFTAPKESAAASPSTRTAGASWHPYLGVGGGGVAGRF